MKTPPQDNEIEVSIFGPGYGECILIHLGNQEWVSVDSCVFDGNDLPAPLNYLKELGKDYKECIKQIIATHWDDDHIKSLHQIVLNCPSAKFCVSGALNNKKFIQFLADSPPALSSSQITPSGFLEFKETYLILKERNQIPEYAIKNKLLMKSTVADFEVWSLSPHESVFEKSIAAILSQIPDRNSSAGKITPPSPNQTSVVLYFKIHDERILLGADLDSEEGWAFICDEGICVDKKAQVFKVPHHGSENGDHPRVWDELLDNNPLCLIAPWSLAGRRLPKPSDIKRIKERSTEIYISSKPDDGKIFKEGDGFLGRKIKDKKVKQLQSKFGLVRLRKTIGSDQWNVECFGDAYSVNSD